MFCLYLSIVVIIFIQACLSIQNRLKGGGDHKNATQLQLQATCKDEKISVERMVDLMARHRLMARIYCGAILFYFICIYCSTGWRRRFSLFLTFLGLTLAPALQVPPPPNHMPKMAPQFAIPKGVALSSVLISSHVSLDLYSLPAGFPAPRCCTVFSNLPQFNGQTSYLKYYGYKERKINNSQ